jgi:hypothetical protein
LACSHQDAAADDTRSRGRNSWQAPQPSSHPPRGPPRRTIRPRPFFGGARQEQPFKDYLRGRQLPSQVWYSAYPDLTAVNIENNARIRAGLRGELSSEEADAWLRRI